jgi:hypothetical protein
MKLTIDLDSFTRAYIVAALWSSMDESRPDGGDPLDYKYNIEDLAPETLERIERDCAKFQAENAEALIAQPRYTGCPAIEYAGHDFWLTRNGHGCGFWDGGWPEPQATQLTEAARKFGECDLYVGDDGRLYLQ